MKPHPTPQCFQKKSGKYSNTFPSLPLNYKSSDPPIPIRDGGLCESAGTGIKACGGEEVNITMPGGI
jgi:hypothetical protein